MLWFSVWTVLVLATLGGAFLLGRSLWRSAVGLGRELSRAAEVTAALADKVEQLNAAAGVPDTGATLFADRDVLRARRAELRGEAAVRRAPGRSAGPLPGNAGSRTGVELVEPDPRWRRYYHPVISTTTEDPDMWRNINGVHVLIVLLVVVLLFGAKRLPDLAKSVGQSMKIFKREVKDLREEDPPVTTTPAAPVPPVGVTPVDAPPVAAPVVDPQYGTPARPVQEPSEGHAPPKA